MRRSKIILIFIIALVTLVYANPFSTYKEYLGLTKAKQDSFYVENPVISVSMNVNDTIQIVVSNIFNYFPDNVEWHPNVVDASIINAELYQDGETDDLYIEIISNNNIGRTDVTYTAYCDSTVNNEASDTFTVTVDDPTFDWVEIGNAYSFFPEYCVGRDSNSWKAATHFSFGTDSMYLKQIEFGFLEEEMVDWKLVKFNEMPTDTIINNLANSVFCSAAAPSYIDAEYIESNFADTYFTGDVALVFSSEGNYMSMDPSAESANTWIYTDGYGWALANSYTSAYDGAWYMRLQVFNLTTGIEETYYSGTISNFKLEQNYPNPFNPTTEINFTLNHNSLTKLRVFNSSGKVVKTLNDGKLAKGYHSFNFDGHDLNSGVYFYQLEVDGVRSTKKMILMK